MGGEGGRGGGNLQSPRGPASPNTLVASPFFQCPCIRLGSLLAILLLRQLMGTRTLTNLCHEQAGNSHIGATAMPSWNYCCCCHSTVACATIEFHDSGRNFCVGQTSCTSNVDNVFVCCVLAIVGSYVKQKNQG